MISSAKFLAAHSGANLFAAVESTGGSAGLVGVRLHFNRLKLEPVPDVFGKYADTPGIDPLSRIDIFIKDD